MTTTINVTIIGDKTQFKSKNAIVRVKQDIKENPSIVLDSSKYLNDGFILIMENNNNNVNLNIKSKIELEENKMNDEKDKKKLELRAKIKDMKKTNMKERSGDINKKLASLKRTVPTKIYNSYANLVSKFKMENIPAPDEVINNVDKYKIQISAVMGKIGKLSDDVRASNAILHYFTTLGEFLGIEPLKLSKEEMDTFKNMGKLTNNNMKRPTINNSDTEDEDD